MGVLWDILFVAGVILAAIGFGMMYVPLGLVVLGVTMAAVGVLGARNGRDRGAGAT